MTMYYYFLREAKVENTHTGKRKLRWFISVGLNFLNEAGDKGSQFDCRRQWPCLNLTKEWEKEAGRVNWSWSCFPKASEISVTLCLPLSTLLSTWQLNVRFCQMASFLFCWFSLWHFQKPQCLRLWHVLEMTVTGMDCPEAAVQGEHDSGRRTFVFSSIAVNTYEGFWGVL